MSDTISLNGVDTSYNNIYYISVNGNDSTGDGTKDNPYATYDKAFSVATNGDLIYFIKGDYNISSLKKINTYVGSSFIYDSASSISKQLIIYAEPFTYITINNPVNNSRDSHIICLNNVNSKVTGFIFDYNITNKTLNYERSIFGANDSNNTTGYIYNCHFILRSTTSFSYANSGNTLQCIDCQFDIQSPLESAYTGTTKFVNCAMNISNWSTNYGIASNSDILTSISYDLKYRIVPTNTTYGVYSGSYIWSLNKFLIKQNNQYYSIKPEFYQNDQYSPITLAGGDIPNDDDFNNNGIDNINDLCNKYNTEKYLSSGEVLDDGKLFTFSIPNNIKNINNVD